MAKKHQNRLVFAQKNSKLQDLRLSHDDCHLILATSLVVVAAVCARSTACFFPQSEFANDHGTVGRLTHVIDRERRSGASVKRFHFDSRAIDGVNLNLNCNVIVTDFEVDVHRPDEEWVAKRDHVGGALGGLDTGDSCNSEDVAFFHFSVSNCRSGLRLHEYFASRNRSAVGRLFESDVHHSGVAHGVEVAEGGI